MSLFKQMALAISFIIVVLVGSIMVINYQSSKQNMIQSLYETTANNISSITSQLSQAGNNPALITTIIDAEFDSGYFKEISFTSNDTSFSYIQIDNEPMERIPLWFIDFTDISIKSVRSDVTSGWDMIGTVKVKGDTAIVYKALYKMFLQLLYIFIISVITSLLVLSMMLKIILRPLKNVQKQAEAIAKNEFILQEKIPYTKEFRDVVLGMNKMVSKVKAMFDKGNEELKLQKEREYIDQITQLKNRKYLTDKLPEFLKIDASSKGGIFIMIALNGMKEANEQIGHEQVDTLFNKFANIFRATVKGNDNAIISRMDGTEFALFIPDCTSSLALEFAQSILKKSQKSITESNLDPQETYLSIGIYEYNYQESIDSVLFQSDNALSKAKLNDINIHLATPTNITEVMGKDSWREIIVDAIEYQKFQFVSWPVVDVKAEKNIHYALSLTLQAEKNYHYGQFIAPANQAGLGNDIYITALEILFQKTDKKLYNTICSLRLPYEFLIDTNSYSYMQILFKKYAKKLPIKLIVEMPDKFISQNTELVHKYKKLLEKSNIDLGIFEFIGESKEYHYLQELRPVHINAQSNYFLSQSKYNLSTLRLITDALDIQLIANGVMDENTLKELQIKDIQIVQGRATELIRYS